MSETLSPAAADWHRHDGPVRVRIGPSPTGEPHIGTAYTALVNITFAKRHGGRFVLRIEDTDRVRYTPESEGKIMEALHWLGLTWDEGPDVGGPFGPYRQSERGDLYRKYADELLSKGKAFKCFCTPERLEEMRAEQRRNKEMTRYDGRCLHLTAEEVAAKEAAGEAHVVRMTVPTEGECSFHDGIFGQVTIPWTSIDMQVLLKSDGMATYHLANVVDDHLMEISHVLRGEEWVSSTPKHILLYSHFGWQPPKYAHLPVLRNPDRTKLSKRKNPTSISWFKARGYLPEAILNFLGLPFVSIAEGEEMMDAETFTKSFDLTAVAKAGGIFDLTKLDWLNGRWVREMLSEEEYQARVLAWATADGVLSKALELARTRIKKFGDLPDLLAFLLASDVTITKDSFGQVKLDEKDIVRVLVHAADLADALPAWTAADIEGAVRRMSDDLGLKMRNVAGPLYLAITGKTQSVPLFDAMELLGRSVCRHRLRLARDLFDWKWVTKEQKNAAAGAEEG